MTDDEFVRNEQTGDAPKQLVFVGEITSAFGIRGEIKMLPAMDDPKQLLKIPSVLFRWTGKNAPPEQRLKVVSLRRHQNAALLTVDGIPDRTEAERFPGAQLFVYRAELPELGDDTYYEADLIGMTVMTESGKALGTVTRVHFIPQANDVYETETAMIPAIGDVVIRVDTAAKKIVVRDMPGLRKDEA